LSFVPEEFFSNTALQLLKDDTFPRATLLQKGLQLCAPSLNPIDQRWAKSIFIARLI
jgi:hypothetical protein